MNKKIFLAIFSLILLMLISIQFSVVSVYARPSFLIIIFDRFIYECLYSIEKGYKENVAHEISISVSGISPEYHNFTLILETNEKLINIFRHNGLNIQNRSDNGKIIINAFSQNCSSFSLDIILGNEYGKKYPDPFDILILPEDLDILPIDNEGYLKFNVYLNASCFLNNAYLNISSSAIIENFFIETYLKWESKIDFHDVHLKILNISQGEHLLKFIVKCKNLNGNFKLKLLTSKPETTFPIKCFLDNTEVTSDKLTLIQYFLQPKEFTKAVTIVNHIYGYYDYSYYIINFTVNENFILRIDRNLREKVKFLYISSEIKDLNIEDTSVYGNPCYILHFRLASKSNVSIGLMIYDKIWFISSKDMNLKDIPPEIVNKYTNPCSLDSPYSIYTDKDNSLVLNWNKQIVNKETNPYRIVFSLFKNLTSTIKYDKSLSKQWLKASEILALKKGVCVHYSIAYAALCMANNIPVRIITGSVIENGIIYKKNHSWNEVFLPRYGWVPVDVTWNISTKLPSSHIIYTIFNYMEGTLNVTNIPIIVKSSEHTLLKIFDICNKKLSDIKNYKRFVLWVPPSIENDIEVCNDKLLKTELFIKYEYVYDALTYISEICLSLRYIQQIILIFIGIQLIGAIIILYIIIRKLLYKNGKVKRTINRLLILGKY